jgi:hypothetical protein
MGEGLGSGAEAPPFQSPPVSAAQAIFMQGGEPKDHEIFALQKLDGLLVWVEQFRLSGPSHV